MIKKAIQLASEYIQSSLDVVVKYWPIILDALELLKTAC